MLEYLCKQVDPNDYDWTALSLIQLGGGMTKLHTVQKFLNKFESALNVSGLKVTSCLGIAEHTLLITVLG